ncbi:hypothetical protein POL82_03130 [Priestia aryabhattai]|uniref:hypothetical protein n=1 Tax=Priestia aryabhattai TaxID=412384 RepID=UPI00234E4450|nr:hypothetical protein [Priestia aryabhattai]MDC7762459.1 hypothetical protein [Priestia aryabhattai]
MNYHNPATSLHELLEKASEKASSLTNFRETWSEVFELEPDDNCNLIKKYSILIDLYEKTRFYVEASNNTSLKNDKNLMFLDQIDKGLNHVNFNGNMSHFNTHITSETLLALGYIAQFISIIYEVDDSKLTKEDINSLLSEIELLNNNLQDSSLPTDIINIICKNLDLIRASLVQYRYYGIEGLRDALEKSIGSFVMHEEQIIAEGENETVKGVFNLIIKLKTLFETANVGKELIAPVLKHFLKQ